MTRPDRLPGEEGWAIGQPAFLSWLVGWLLGSLDQQVITSGSGCV